MSSAQSELPLTPAALQQMARQAAVSAGVSPNHIPLFLSLIQHESNWNPEATSPAGAVGLGQLMPATAKSLGVSSPTDPVQNLRGAAMYFNQQLNAFGGNPNLALAAYNAGPSAVKKYGGIPPYAETQAYVKNVLGGAANYQHMINPPQGGTAPGLSSDAFGAQPPAPQMPNALKLPGFGDISGTLEAGGVPKSVVSTLNYGTSGLNAMIAHHMGVGVDEFNNVKNTAENFSFNMKNPASGISRQAAGAIRLAREYLGTPYVWGGESAKGFDCSGLLQYIWAKQGVNIPRTTYDQWNVGQRVPQGKLQPGDAVFFKGSDSRTLQNGRVLPGHVAIYIGNGEVIQSPHTGATVEITPLKDMHDFMGARRYS